MANGDVLQYIGPRFVPKLFQAPDGSMTWQANTYYEPLTMVSYNNASYISRIPVPAAIGNPASNSPYWAMTGNFNAQFQEFQEDVDTQIADLTTSVNQQIATLTASVNSQITGLDSKKISKLGYVKAKYVLLISDSYEEWSAWATNCKAYLNAAGVQCDVSAASGAGFSLSTSFLNLYTSSPHRGIYTDVLIGGGINDRNDISGALTAIQALIAQVYADGALFHYANFGDFWQNSQRLSLYNLYQQEAETVVKAGGVMVPNCQGMLYRKEMFASDGIHPSTQGGIFLGEQIANYLLGGGVNYSAVVYNSSTGETVNVHNNFKIYTAQSIKFQTPLTISSGRMTVNAADYFTLLNPGNLRSYTNVLLYRLSESKLYTVEIELYADTLTINPLQSINWGGSETDSFTLYGVFLAGPTAIM